LHTFFRYALQVIVRYYSIRAYGRTGAGAIAPDARYCAVLWHGEHRIERRHIPGGSWKQLEAEATAAPSSVAIESEVHRAFAPNDKAAEIIATDLIDLTAAPLRIAAAIDAQLREQAANARPSP
jgi:hypothetical protein